MKQFDVFNLKSNPEQYVLNIQSDIFSDLKARTVIPMVRVEQFHSERENKLQPIISVNGNDYILITNDIAPLPISELKNKIVNLENKDYYKIMDAIDFLIRGF